MEGAHPLDLKTEPKKALLTGIGEIEDTHGTNMVIIRDVNMTE